MNIEEMQKYWDSENQRTLYTIDESAMDRIVLKKSESANKKSKLVEDIIIVMNILVPIFLLMIYWLNNRVNVGAYLTAAFMLSSAAYILIARRRRENEWKSQGDTVLNHLDEAIHNATATAKMTNAFLIWYILGIGSLNVVMLIVDDTPWYLVVGVSFFFIIAIIAGRWEQRAWHDKRRDDLIALREKIIDTV
jgi:hypothetical protein